MKRILIILLAILLASLFIACPTQVYFKLTITIEGTGSGTITADGTTVTSGTPIEILKDESVELVIDPTEGSNFSGWTGANASDVTGTSSPYTIIMDTDKVLIATFTVGSNSAPNASNVTISGVAAVGQTLIGDYDYADANGDLEGTSTFRWLSCSTMTGTYEAIVGATSLTYILQTTDAGKYVKFEVTPVAQTGTTQGTAVQSSAVGPIFTGGTITLSITPDTLYESPSNDGSLVWPNSVTIKVNGTTFVNGISLASLTANNLPTGLSLDTFTPVNDHIIKVFVSGLASSHTNANDTTFTITVDSAAIIGATTDYTTTGVLIDFSDDPAYYLLVKILPEEAETEGCSITYSPNTYPLYNYEEVVTMTVNTAAGWAFNYLDGESIWAVSQTGPNTYTITMTWTSFLDAHFVRTVAGDTFAEPFEGAAGNWNALTSGNTWVLSKETEKTSIPILQGTEVHNGSQAVRFGNVLSRNYGYESSFAIGLENITTEKALSFWYKKNTGTTNHSLILRIDGNYAVQITNDTTDWTQVQLPLSTGAHTISFHSYNYDWSVNTTDTNNIWIDDITLETPVPNLEGVNYGTIAIPHDAGGTTPVDIGSVSNNIGFGITISNTGTGTLNISSVTLVGGASTITLESFPTTIAPNDAEDIIFKATPVGGPYTSGLVTINSNDADIPVYQFAFTCTVVFFKEGFESETFPPAGWTSYNVDGGGTEWIRDTANPHTGIGLALHMYSFESTSQEGWLVTPAIDCTGKTSVTLNFWRSDRSSPYNYHGVWISTTGANPTVATFTEFQGLGAGSFDWTSHTFDISSYAAGQSTVYIGFKYTGQNADIFCLDDVEVTTN